MKAPEQETPPASSPTRAQVEAIAAQLKVAAAAQVIVAVAMIALAVKNAGSSRVVFAALALAALAVAVVLHRIAQRPSRRRGEFRDSA